jgi:hypothetical protein
VQFKAANVKEIAKFQSARVEGAMVQCTGIQAKGNENIAEIHAEVQENNNERMAEIVRI